MSLIVLLMAALTVAQATPRSHHGVVVADTIVWQSTDPTGHITRSQQALGPSRTLVLTPPIDSAEHPQHLAIEGMQIDVDPVHGLRPHVRYWTDPRLTHRQRRRLKRLTPSGRHHGVYFIADGTVAARGGLQVTLREKGQISVLTHVIVGGIFAALLLGLFAMYRGLDGSARRAANQYYIDNELGASKANRVDD